ncbi:MAG TPA: 1-(5-phosphoribosyl)-5-[(5-phosphoribosylamino)methylideneamino] imidazole-4-carboxamide isomerase [Bacteroidota bacterium]|nr:1-(5-phosphoribosyl)-5-[(5-phosphoribosylamino)methylideneamino] imidazole-4-carboxamide isomerase [Bacteroidota bacterium]
MFLVIPAIEIKSGKCVEMIQGVEGYVYSDDPIEMAKLWRKENAKSLHVTDVDGALEGRLVNFDVIERMVKTVDIPIELGGGLRTIAEVRRAFDAGVYRVVLGTILIENPDEAKKILDTFGASKVVFGIDAAHGYIMTRGYRFAAGLTALSAGLNAKALGFRRIVYTDITLDGTLRGLDLPGIRMLGEKTGLRITASGGISGLADLLRLRELEPYGVDSAVIGRALHSNKFACQELWRMCEAGNYPYTAKI